MMKKTTLFITLFLLFFVSISFAQDASTELLQQLPKAQFDEPNIITKLAILSGVALLPYFIMLLTSFIKIIIVLSLLRNALGVQQTPPNQVLNGIALLLTIYVMFPTGVAMYNASKKAIDDSPKEIISQKTPAYLINVVDHAKEPMRNFLQKNCVTKHIQGFYQIAERIFPEPYKSDLKNTDFIILIPSFITSQLKMAFEIGVLIYLPFFVIDIVTSNILLAMGMMMLSPLTIALPIKLFLLVVIDGWTILMQGLILTFR